MNKALKYAGMLAILSVFVVAAAPVYIGQADAENADGSPGTIPPKSYGKATQSIVCGGALCGDSAADITPVTVEAIKEVPGVTPIVRIVGVNNFSDKSPNTFNAVFELTTGDSNIVNAQIQVSSDRQSVETTVNGQFAFVTSVNTVKIQAHDPTSITAELLSFELND
ncbi:MAG: hypothetical protein O6761_03105 [Thaumarchaeota archaeon]|nr:hypothetical protein [Nitrososphaerota archaeon]